MLYSSIAPFSPWRITCKARRIKRLNRILSSTPIMKRRLLGPCWSGRRLTTECAWSSWDCILTVADQTPRLLCVAGAGRGPLVARALKAISRAKRKAFIHVVEKNPNAFVTYVIYPPSTTELPASWILKIRPKVAGTAENRMEGPGSAPLW